MRVNLRADLQLMATIDHTERIIGI